MLPVFMFLALHPIPATARSGLAGLRVRAQGRIGGARESVASPLASPSRSCSPCGSTKRVLGFPAYLKKPLLRNTITSATKTPGVGKAVASVGALAYWYWVFVSDVPPGNMVLKSSPETLKLALDCSINFWFILPTFASDLAPQVHPVMEGLFNFVVTWTMMMFGFYTEAREQKKISTLGFFIAMPFLTNAVYLPYLALRESPVQPLRGDQEKRRVFYRAKRGNGRERKQTYLILRRVLTLEDYSVLLV
eukprot:CAMPEP_0114488718 /NCGR_PEP_ID=MMETSP0109-20121206/1483_1 /TAXON_ID=29199 /ORGANISM="Chlorarachnion reptans, Strain CCCM449" /LENGTH=248 /DNA_ID=CAMNT_0001665137 /DNA_START=79 /DNA_END=825 /DNA_ORIENTATION=+